MHNYNLNLPENVIVNSKTSKWYNNGYIIPDLSVEFNYSSKKRKKTTS